MEEPRRRAPGEGAFAIIVLIASLFLAWQAYEISGFTALSSPGAFPMAAAGAMVIGSLIVVIRTFRERLPGATALIDRARAFSAEITPAVVVVFGGFVIGYAAVLDTLGFLPASFLFLFAAIKFLHRGSALFTLAVTVGSLILIYIVFRLVFTVVLPEGIMPEREILAWIERLFASGGAE